MKIGEFVKKSLVPVVAVLFLALLFRPLCIENGECDCLKLWFCMGIPFGICRMFLWVVPKGYDIGGTIGIWAVNLIVGGIIGGIVLVWKLTAAMAYLVKAIVSGCAWVIRKMAADA